MGRLAISLGDGKLCDEALKKLRGQLRAVWATELLRALRCMRDRRWGEARLVLEKLRERGLPRPELITQAEVMLADCYQALGNPDQQVLAARRALQGNAFSVPARLRLAAGLARQAPAPDPGRASALGRLAAALEAATFTPGSDDPA